MALWIALPCLLGATAGASEGLFLTWHDCAQAPSSHNQSSPCGSNVGEQTLYCAFTLPAAVDSVLGVDVVVDLQHSAATVPGWWQLAPGGCRAGQLSASIDFSSNFGCADFWLNEGAGSLQAFEIGPPRWGPNQVRIKIAGALPSGSTRALPAAEMFYAAKLVLRNGATEGTGACAGCLGPACLVLNSIQIRRHLGAAGGDLFLQQPGPGSAHFATWQGNGADCSAVPARSVSWGRLKGLYR